MADSYARLIGESLTFIDAEAPACSTALATTLRNLRLAITIDGEQFGIDANPITRVVPTPPSPSVHISSTGAAIVEVLNANASIEELVIADRLVVRGTLDDVTTTHGAFMHYVHGALRATSVPGLRPRLDSLVGAAS